MKAIMTKLNLYLLIFLCVNNIYAQEKKVVYIGCHIQFVDTIKIDNHCFYNFHQRGLFSNAYYNASQKSIEIFIYNLSKQKIGIIDAFSSKENFDYNNLIRKNCDTSYIDYYLDMNPEILKKSFSNIRDYEIRFSEYYVNPNNGIHLSLMNFNELPSLELVMYYNNFIVHKNEEFKLNPVQQLFIQVDRN